MLEPPTANVRGGEVTVRGGERQRGVVMFGGHVVQGGARVVLMLLLLMMVLLPPVCLSQLLLVMFVQLGQGGVVGGLGM